MDINTTSTDKVQLVPDEYYVTSNPNMYMYNLYADLSEEDQRLSNSICYSKISVMTNT